MGLKRIIKKNVDAYAVRQVKNLKIPELEASELARYRFVFSGRVQRVGFRIEVQELAKRLGLTGFCDNLENGDVIAELQGEENRICYLVSYMESLKRIKIRNKVSKRLEVNQEESEFRAGSEEY